MIPASPNYFFYGLLLAVIGLAFLIFMPFLTPVVLAGAIAVAFGPAHRYIIKWFFKGNERSSGAALVTLIIITLIILIPALLITGKIYSEVQSMYTYLTDESGRSQVISGLNRITQYFSHAFFDLYPAYSFDALNITEVFQKILVWVFSNLDSVFSGASKAVLAVFIMMIALFYFVRDGRQLKREIIALSPLLDADDENIFRKLEQTIRAIFTGSIIVAIIQGILTGIGFAIFGVPSPALWGLIAALAALIPGVGTSLILVPAVLYLFFVGSTGAAIGLGIWAAFAVGLVDNFLGPIFINRGVKIHPFLILLSVLGGLIFFGLIGFILGPIILALLFSLLEIYRTSRIHTPTN